ncbi:hypothetical protein H8744_09250 [Oscillospiraceae bacterium N12]|jgi:hypothetical protein|uniref:DUF6249 domain-containing protein n=1 Tax=Jilunia laotingensis TaxID=2763675 RepID=A0A926IK17_9BACT|nr:DUF6249 domain-containing protein [Jilunia laotingensis]MBC8593427.1 hypothetical protein [Jilunia laotingensis]
MKQILITLTLMLAVCSLAAQKKTVLYADSNSPKGIKTVVAKTTPSKDSTYTPDYTDTPDTGVTVESDMEDASDTVDMDAYDDVHNINLIRADLLKDIGSAAGAGIALSLFILLLIFGFPIFVIFIAFYYRYKSRRDRYRLVEKAIASGQPIPDSILKESLNADTTSKGIKNICLGIGLFIFLWAFTNSFAMGCIGLLIMFTGIGQYLVGRKQKPTDEEK